MCMAETSTSPAAPHARAARVPEVHWRRTRTPRKMAGFLCSVDFRLPWARAGGLGKGTVHLRSTGTLDGNDTFHVPVPADGSCQW